MFQSPNCWDCKYVQPCLAVYTSVDYHFLVYYLSVFLSVFPVANIL